MAILKHIIPLAIATLMAGCYEDFTPQADTRPVLCINALITAGEPFDVQVTHTWRYDDPSTDRFVNDAEVSIYANGNSVGRDYIAREGDVIRIVATSPTYGEAEATITVPFAASVDATDWDLTVVSEWTIPDYDYGPSYSYGSFTLEAGLNVHAQADAPGYYRFFFESFNDNKSFYEIGQGSLQYDSEPIFAEHIGSFESLAGADADGFSFFTDRQFPGRSYPLHLVWHNMSWTALNRGEPIEPLGLRLSVASVSESYYKYELFCWHLNNGTLSSLGDAGFGDPLWAYSNVSTGAGIVAAQAVTTHTIDLKDFITQTIQPNSEQ